MSAKALLVVAAATGGYLYLNRKKDAAVTYQPPQAVRAQPTRYEVQQADDALKLTAMAGAGVPLKPSTRAKFAQYASMAGSVGGAAGCVAIGAAAAAPLCAIAGGWAAGKVAPAVYGAGKATARVGLKVLKSPVRLVKSPIKSVKWAVKTPKKIFRKVKFW